jgi:hypothetical protein
VPLDLPPSEGVAALAVADRVGFRGVDKERAVVVGEEWVAGRGKERVGRGKGGGGRRVRK